MLCLSSTDEYKSKLLTLGVADFDVFKAGIEFFEYASGLKKNPIIIMYTGLITMGTPSESPHEIN